MKEPREGGGDDFRNRATVDTFLEDLANAPSVSAPQTPATPIEGVAPGPMSARELCAGDRLGKRFEVISELGRGGFGAVYLARDLELGRHVAIKVLGLGRSRRLRTDELALFDREAKATARLNHPNIVTVYDWGTWEGLPYLVLERLKGEPLSKRLERGALAADDAVATGIQIARGLAHAHSAGVLHLDLKPHNIFVCDDALVKILDLGLAQLDPSTDSHCSALQGAPWEPAEVFEKPLKGGTPAYMAPEQWRGEAPDERTDLWAVGVILFEALCGKLPFVVTGAGSTATSSHSAPTVKDCAPAVPADLASLVARCLQKQRADRLPSATELLDELHAVERALVGPGTDIREPYRYLEPFTEADATWFFGRDREARRLMRMLETRPLVALVGPSGAGKSSLVQAGLIPRLKRGGHEWTVVAMRPGSDSLRLLQNRLRDLNVEVTDLADKPGMVGEALRAYAQATGHRVLLYVDQFEELFTHAGDADQRSAFVAALLSAADDPVAPVRVVVTLRADFLGDLSQYHALRDQVSDNNLILGPPDADAMTEALEEPARRLGHDFEIGLAAEMVGALEKEAAPLPLLQLAASRLWEKRDRERRLLTRKVLDNLGGVVGVLAAHAEEVLQQISGESEQWIAREIFLRLVTADGIRRPMNRETLLAIFPDAKEANRILEHLLRGRLLTSSKRDGKAWIELAHEALVERWDRLRGWLGDEDASAVRDLLREEARSNERYVNYFRGLGWCAAGLVELGARGFGEAGHQTIMPPLFIAWGLLILLLNKTLLKNRFHRLYPPLLSSVDVIVLTLAISSVYVHAVEFHPDMHAGEIVTRASMGYLLLLALNMVRFSWRQVLWSGALNFCAYLFLRLYSGTFDLKDATDYFVIVGLVTVLIFTTRRFRAVLELVHVRLKQTPAHQMEARERRRWRTVE